MNLRRVSFLLLFTMDDAIVPIALGVYAIMKLKGRKEKKKRNRTTWVKPYLAERQEKSKFHLVTDLQMRLQDKEEFRAYLRMDVAAYTVSLLYLITLVNPPYYTLFYEKGPSSENFFCFVPNFLNYLSK